MEKALTGWDSALPAFVGADRRVILESLRALVPDANEGQVRAWNESVPALQQEGRALLAVESAASGYGTILEYVLPMESRRPDCIFLIDGAVVVENIRRENKPGYGYNAASDTYGIMADEGIIDPTKVTRSALQNAASVAAMVLTTESLVTDIPTPPAPAAAPGPDMGGMY